MRRITTLAFAAASLLLAACELPADVASKNLSKAADNFEIVRKITFYNTWADTALLEVTGRCSIGNHDSYGKLSITCRDGENYVKHYLGLSGHVTFFAEQLVVANVSEYHTRIMWRPQTIVPDVDFQGNVEELTTNRN
jgi:hypothetical protein